MVARLAVSNKQIVECFNIKIVKLFWLGFWGKRTKVHLIRIYSNTFFLKEWVLRQLAKSCKNASSGLWLNPIPKSKQCLMKKITVLATMRIMYLQVNYFRVIYTVKYFIWHMYLIWALSEMFAWHNKACWERERDIYIHVYIYRERE